MDNILKSGAKTVKVHVNWSWP